jgi:putative ABC transport system substrate-binding protein
MKGKRKIKWIRILCITLQVLLASQIALADTENQIVIVKSSDNHYFNQTIQTLINRTDQSLRLRVIGADDISDESSLLEKGKLVIALGIKASEAITRRFPDKPIISAYLTQQQWQKFKPRGKTHFAILLDQPLERYLAFSHALLNVNSVGIVNFAPIVLDKKQKSILSRLKFSLSQYQPGQADQLLASIRQLIQHDDALLMLPNQNIYNRDTLKGILLTSYRNSVPVISYSPAHVKSGALAAIYSSPEDIGKHLGDVLNQFLSEQLWSKNTQQFARFYSIITNNRVAHSLGLKLPDAIELRRKLTEIVE